MTEAEWFEAGEAWQPLIYFRSFASIRKLRLIAAAYALWLQSHAEYADARHCAHIIEEVADAPKHWDEIEPRMYDLPGGSGWQLSGVLHFADRKHVGESVSKLVFFADGTLKEPVATIHSKMIHLARDVVGNPFRPAVFHQEWRTATAMSLAEGIYIDRAFDRLPILADALEDAGCTNAAILDHCRQPGEHVRGCWAVDLVLAKE